MSKVALKHVAIVGLITLISIGLWLYWSLLIGLGNVAFFLDATKPNCGLLYDPTDNFKVTAPQAEIDLKYFTLIDKLSKIDYARMVYDYEYGTVVSVENRRRLVDCLNARFSYSSFTMQEDNGDGINSFWWQNQLFTDLFSFWTIGAVLLAWAVAIPLIVLIFSVALWLIQVLFTLLIAIFDAVLKFARSNGNTSAVDQQPSKASAPSQPIIIVKAEAPVGNGNGYAIHPPVYQTV